jgi:tripartite-type tricarboxylate transporter receptor subunit TctC
MSRTLRSRPQTLLLLAGLCLQLLCNSLVSAQNNPGGQSASWPNRPVRFIVPFVAGSSPDVTARLIAPKLSEALGQPVLVENRGGAAGIIGAELVSKAAADGYTLLYPVNSVICANQHLYSKLPYDALKSFVPVTMTVNFGYVLLARSNFPANDLKSLLAMARAEPGKLNFGSAGLGAGNHVVMEMLLDMTGTPPPCR